MNVDYLVFFDNHLIGVVSQRAHSCFAARSIHKSCRRQFRTHQQAARWVNEMHALATNHWDVLKATLPTSAALYCAYGTLANGEQLFVPTERALALGDKVLLELSHEKKRFYIAARIVLLNPESSSRLPVGVGLEAVFSEQLRKRLKNHQGSLPHSGSSS